MANAAATQLRQLVTEARTALNSDADSEDFVLSARNLVQSTTRLFRRRPDGMFNFLSFAIYITIY